MKRYFYAKDNKKIKRQVIWLEGDPSFCFLDYRHEFRGKIVLKNILLPPNFDLFQLVITANEAVTSYPSLLSDKIDSSSEGNTGHVVF
jgi:hypothetical protein